MGLWQQKAQMAGLCSLNRSSMKWMFWISLGTILYTYLGYPIILFLRSRLGIRAVRAAPILPKISIVMAVRNEVQTLPDKLRNLSQLDYPQELMEVVVVSDGSTDGTNELLSQWANERLRVLFLTEHQGKAIALNRGINEARGEVLVFTDTRQKIEADALQHLLADLADPEVGCVSGELMLVNPTSDSAGKGVGLYWQIEKKIRQWESFTGSVPAASGALYAVPRSLVVCLPGGTVLDDVYIPLHVARQGLRVVFEPGARAWDNISPTLQHEFRRKVRTLTGYYQLLQLSPWILSASNPVLFRFVSHKLLRLLMPFSLAAVFISALLLHAAVVYRTALLMQIVFYAFGLVGLTRCRLGFITRASNAAVTFLTLNAAALVAFANVVTGRKAVWTR